MAGWVTPAQQFDHELNVVKGWPSPYALDKSAGIATADRDSINSGSLVHLDPTTGLFTLGCPNGYMPIFAFPSSRDFDVGTDVGNIAGGNLMGLVATGGFEMETTEFVADGLAVQTPLTPASGDDLGKVKAGAIDSTDMIVGICSSAPFVNEWRKDVVRFWPVYMPNRRA